MPASAPASSKKAGKTPSKTPSKGSKTPSKEGKTPSKTPSKEGKTPSKTPSSSSTKKEAAKSPAAAKKEDGAGRARGGNMSDLATKPVPEKYVCKLCKEKGHWMLHCKLFVAPVKKVALVPEVPAGDLKKDDGGKSLPAAQKKKVAKVPAGVTKPEDGGKKKKKKKKKTTEKAKDKDKAFRAKQIELANNKKSLLPGSDQQVKRLNANLIKRKKGKPSK